jgi:phage-related protein
MANDQHHPKDVDKPREAEYTDISISPPVKPIVWLGSSRRDLRQFPESARQIAGFELFEVQRGGEPSDFKSMRTVGAGVFEIRVHADGEFRVLYVAKFAEAVYVLHAFGKRTRKTSRQDLNIASRRYADLISQRMRGS